MCCCDRQKDDRIIASLARQNAELEAKVQVLEEEARRRRSWLDDAKRAAGFNSNTSFDDVWAAALATFLKSKEST